MKLYPLLHEYLVAYNHLPLPGAGDLSFISAPARLQEADGVIAPPLKEIIFTAEPPADREQQALVSFISQNLQVSVKEAALQLEEEGNLSESIVENHEFDWPGLGLFSKGNSDKITFLPAAAHAHYLPVIALQAIHAEPEAEVKMVAEPLPDPVVEEPVTEIAEPPAQKDRWWLWAILIFVFCVVMILIRFLAMS